MIGILEPGRDDAALAVCQAVEDGRVRIRLRVDREVRDGGGGTDAVAGLGRDGRRGWRRGGWWWRRRRWWRGWLRTGGCIAGARVEGVRRQGRAGHRVEGIEEQLLGHLAVERRQQ